MHRSLRFLFLLALTVGAGGCLIDRVSLQAPGDPPDAAVEEDGALGLDVGRDTNTSPNTDAPICGDGRQSTGEACDDNNTRDGDGCSATCEEEDGFDCRGGTCTPVCGDAMIVGTERCDDGDRDAGDGCSDLCEVEPGFVCSDMPSMCLQTCGNGVLDTGEACDDRDRDGGDGCDATCMPEQGWTCTGMPSVCRRNCGNGVVDVGEACDDGDFENGDGCTTGCTIETGYECSGTTPSVCGPRCGDGVIIGGEACDDGFTRPGDGCSSTCTVEPGALCTVIDGTSWCSRSFVYDPPDIRIPSSGTSGLVTIAFSGSVGCTPRRVRAVTLNMRHSAAGDLVITLINGATRAVLTDGIGGTRDMDGSYSFFSNDDTTEFPGSSDPIAPNSYNTVDGSGNRTLALRDLVVGSDMWTLTIDDQEGGDDGTLRRAAIAIYCDPSR